MKCGRKLQGSYTLSVFVLGPISVNAVVPGFWTFSPSSQKLAKLKELVDSQYCKLPALQTSSHGPEVLGVTIKANKHDEYKIL